MHIDYSNVLPWIYLFNSIALIHMALKQLRKRRAGKPVDARLQQTAQAEAQWTGSVPDALVQKLGKESNYGDFDFGTCVYQWQGDRFILEAWYKNREFTGFQLRQRDSAFPDLGTYFNCSILAALACSWKLLAGLAVLHEATDALPVGTALKQYVINFALFMLAAWIISFGLKRHQLLLSAGCILMTLLSLPLIDWP
ncbi:MAG: hypothetical protein GAK35_00187 [Herbaspirillum frisingense]|uniref:Uncharacterized protein n=1 Tax=Herbaspirillum frisingense TaxID=92645 RepID=A0A7V8G0I2_9BURK|nr:MAG: hypothetical protein GAK35_00187 [Herbaspirillum frisingense]